jgi:DNA-binding beta-propeller fold protein YncE
MPLTGRERRRRIWLLVILLLLLAMLALGTYAWTQSRTLSVPQLINEGDMVPPPEYLFSITGSGDNALQRPVGVDVADDGRVYVVDFGRRRVSVFNPQGTFLFSFDQAGDQALGNPVHLQIVNDQVWVTDRRLRGLYVFNLDGSFEREFLPKNEDDFVWAPLALAFDRDARLRATDIDDIEQHQLMYFSEDESRTATVGESEQVTDVNEGLGNFLFPNGLAVADDGRVYVADGNNRRVQVFDDAGEFQEIIDTRGVPRGMAIDQEQRLYVADALSHTVDVYDLDGKRITAFGERGFGPGQFNFPNDVALDARGRIYVTDRENNQVQVWGWPAIIVVPDVVPTEDWARGWLLLPLLLLPLLLLLRRRRYVLTPEFVTALVDTGRADLLERRRIKYIAPVDDRAVYEGREIEGLVLTKVVHFEEYSTTDVAAMQDKVRCTKREAIYLTMAERARALLTEEVELRRLGIVAQVRVLDVQEFMEDISARAKDESRGQE